MKKKHSPNKVSRENQAPKAQRGNNEAVNAARCIDPAISALQKFSKMERPPTPYGDVENGRVGEQFLGPVYVPNKFMNGTQSYMQYARGSQSTSWNSSRSSLLGKLDGKPSNFSESYRGSKAELALNSFPVTEKKSPLRLSNEELKTTRRTSFLPKIDGMSKRNSGSLQSVVIYETGLKRSPQTSSETVKLPPAKIRNGNMTWSGNDSPNIFPLETEDSSQQVSDTAAVPKPPSDPHGSKERHNCRRKVKRRKDEDKNK